EQQMLREYPIPKYIRRITMMKIGKAGIGVLARSVVVYVFGISAAFAAYPSGPITLIVPFGAGGITDLVARATAKVLSDQLKQPIIVDNRPGAGGNIAAGRLKHAKRSEECRVGKDDLHTWKG